MNITHICHSDSSGGAARAAYRLHCALRNQGQSSQMLVQKKITGDISVVDASNYLEKVNRFVGKQLIRLQHTDNTAFHTASWFPLRDHLFLKQIKHSDIIHLHWFRVTPSIPTIGAIQKPVIWTLHDMWAFCGSEHFVDENAESRWKNGYSKSTRSNYDKGLDIDRLIWQTKLKFWKQPFNIVTPSHWLRNCVTQSALMHRWPTHVIPNTLDINTFKPLDKAYAKHTLNISQDNKLILFGAHKGKTDPRKGFDLLEKSLKRISPSNGQKFQLAIFGQSEPSHQLGLSMPINWIGSLRDEYTLALLYNAADVMVVPSRQENLPQTGTEAQACGCPVAAFNITGLPDVVVHKETGYLAEAFNTEDLAYGMGWILENKERYNKLSDNARKRAVKLWSPEAVVPQYLNIYRQAIEQHQLASRIRS